MNSGVPEWARCLWLPDQVRDDEETKAAAFPGGGLFLCMLDSALKLMFRGGGA